MRSRAFLFLILSIAFAVSCQRAAELPPAESPTREVRDDLGRAVRVPEKIDRVISLAPNVTEMIFAVGAGDQLVGVTSYCNYPEEAKSIEKIGDTQTPNIEKILALQPQIVVVSTDSQLEAFMKTLDEQGIAVYVTNPKTLDDVLTNVTQLGDLLGKSEYAHGIATSLGGRASFIRHAMNYDRERSPLSEKDKPRVFIQISNEPLFTVGKDSFLTELVEQAGGISVTRDVPSGYPKLSKETAAALNPDVIVISDSADNPEPNAVFRNSNAVKNDRVYRINADIISRPGPRLVDALEEIAAKLKEKN